MIKLLLVIGSVQAMKLEFSKPESIFNEDNVILMGITLINIKNETTSWNLFSENLVPMINSLLYFSPNTRIHFIVVTDKNTLEGISITVHFFSYKIEDLFCMSTMFTFNMPNDTDIYRYFHGMS